MREGRIGTLRSRGATTARPSVLTAVLTVLVAALVGCGSAADSGEAPTTSDRSSSTEVESSTTPTSGTPTVPSTTPPSATGPPTAAPTTGPPPGPSSTAGAAPAGAQPLAGRVVVLDPGHNGANSSNTARIATQVDAGGFSKNCNTTGTAAGDYTESRFNWELAQRLRPRLEALGAGVVLTRPDDEGWGPCIDERGLTASRVGADVLVSLHADGADPSSSGFHVIHPGQVPGYTDGVVEPSAELARLIRDALVANGFRPADYVAGDGLVQRTDLGTLNRAGVPAVMIEAGNMRNAGDVEVLRSADGQERLATAVSDALVRLLARPR